jgi:hypothetical protein
MLATNVAAPPPPGRSGAHQHGLLNAFRGLRNPSVLPVGRSCSSFPLISSLCLIERRQGIWVGEWAGQSAGRAGCRGGGLRDQYRQMASADYTPQYIRRGGGGTRLKSGRRDPLDPPWIMGGLGGEGGKGGWAGGRRERSIPANGVFVLYPPIYPARGGGRRLKSRGTVGPSRREGASVEGEGAL